MPILFCSSWSLSVSVRVPSRHFLCALRFLLGFACVRKRACVFKRGRQSVGCLRRFLASVVSDVPCARRFDQRFPPRQPSPNSGWQARALSASSLATGGVCSREGMPYTRIPLRDRARALPAGLGMQTPSSSLCGTGVVCIGIGVFLGSLGSVCVWVSGSRCSVPIETGCIWVCACACACARLTGT